MGSKLAGFLFDLLRRLIDGDAADGGGAAAESTDAFGHGGRVSMDYRNVIQLNPQFIGDDLRKGRLLPLAMRGCARQDGYFSIRSEEHTSELQSLRHLVCRLL